MKAIIRKVVETKVKNGWNRRNIPFEKELFFEYKITTIYFFGIPVFKSKEISEIPEN